jgi:hypothetical protein
LIKGGGNTTFLHGAREIIAPLNISNIVATLIRQTANEMDFQHYPGFFTISK